VSPDTVIAFLTILGYSLYDTIVVFDRVQENTRGLASTNRLTYSDTVNLSMNQVLARSLNTSLVAILPILSILVIGAGFLGASALEDFGFALFVGLTTGAYSSIFIASPLLAILKEREPRYAEIRRRIDQTGRRKLSPRDVAATAVDTGPAGPGAEQLSEEPEDRSAARAEQLPAEIPYGSDDAADDPAAQGGIPLRTAVPPRAGNRTPPRPRKKGRRR
jgi:preprotein translocase subunit SecF